MNKLLLFLCLSAVASLASAQQSIDAVATPYTQSFDGLVSSGTGDLSSCPGWIIQSGSSVVSDVVADNGGSTDPLFYAYGTGSSSERALGSIASDDDKYAGWFFVNNTESTIRKIILKYKGEQWRNSSAERTGIIDLSAAGAQRDSIQFSYQINPGTLDLSTGGYTTVDAIEFDSRRNDPIEGSASTNGNSPQFYTDNIYILIDVADQGIAPGDSIILRWHHPYTVNFSLSIPLVGGVNVSASKGLGIDEVEVYFFDEHWYIDNSGTTALNLTTWTPMPDGSRPPYADAVTIGPTDFMNNHQYFTFQKDFVSNFTGSFPVTGINSKILVTSDVDVILNGSEFQLLGDVDVRSNASLTLENTDFNADFINLSSGSTVHFVRNNGGFTNVPSADYYNLKLTTTGGGSALNLGDAVNVKGTLSFLGSVDGVNHNANAELSFIGNACSITSPSHNGFGVFPKLRVANGTTLTLGDFPVDANGIETFSHNQEFEVEGDLVIPSSTNLELSDKLINSGAVTINNDGSLVQTSTSILENTGVFNVIRNGSAVSNIFNYWSMPVTSGTASKSGRGGDLTGNLLYKYKKGGKYRSQYQLLPNAPSALEVGRGYAVRAAGVTTFAGTVNNGDITYGVELFEDTSFNLIGNPYPSGILASDFVIANTDKIESNLAIWQQCNDGPASFDNEAEFISVNALGSTSACPGFSGQSLTLSSTHIPSCQGFFVTAHTAGNVVFTNDMRTSVSNNFKSEGNSNGKKGAEPYPTDEVIANATRMWTTVTNTATEGQVTSLVGFVEGATVNTDYWFDAGTIIDPDADFMLYSLNKQKDPFAIQALPELQAHQTNVDLGFIAPSSGQYTVSIEAMNLHETGYYCLFADKLLYRYHLVGNGDYEFTSNAGRFDNRFELIFMREITTELRELIEQKVSLPIGYISSGTFHLLRPFKTIEIVDVTGAMVYNSSNFDQDIDVSKLRAGVYVVAGIDVNGEGTTQKIVVQ